MSRCNNDTILFHAGLLKDIKGSDYFLLANLYTSNDSVKIAKFKITKPNSITYHNVRLKNIEGGIDYTVNDVPVTFYDTLKRGDGHLYSFLPVVRDGGKLTQNEVISSSDTLCNKLEISAGDTLFINSRYTVKDDITVKGTGKIIINNSGLIMAEDSADIILPGWDGKLLRAATLTNHPRIVWGRYNSESPVTYKIYKQTLGDTQLLSDTLTQLSYTDMTETINSGPLAGHTISYLVTAVENLEGEYLTHNSNTINYDIAGKWEEKKQQNKTRDELSYGLCQNYPNPFNPETRINYSLAEDGQATIKVYDILGNEITTLLNEYKSKGNYSVSLNINKVKKLTSGVYFYTIRAGNFSTTKKMIILK